MGGVGLLLMNLPLHNGCSSRAILCQPIAPRLSKNYKIIYIQ